MLPATTIKAPKAASEHVFSRSTRSQLQGKYLGGLVHLGAQMSRMVLLQSGRLLIRDEESESELIAPGILWRGPASAHERFFLCAGSSCEELMLDEIALANAIGHKPEAAALRVFSAGAVMHRLADHPELLANLNGNLQAITREFDARQPGAETIIEAQIRVILVLLWRQYQDSNTTTPAVATRALILLNFRQSVESHFRDRWSVKRYAAQLNVSPDRLHDICSGTLGKTPRQLILDRLAFEARLLLERSEMTLDQISVYLGFKNSPQFNAFFKVHHKLPPGKYRQSVRRSSADDVVDVGGSYADWP